MPYLILTPFFPNKSNFVGSYLLDQAKEINKQIDKKVCVVIIENLFSKSQDYLMEGIQCYVFNKIDFPSFLFPGFFQKYNDYRFSKFLKSKNIVLNKDSVVHGHINYPCAPFLTFLKNKFNCKAILQHHGLDVLQFDTGRINIFKKLQNKIIKNRFIKSLNSIDFQIGVSQKVVNNLINFDSRLANNSYVLYNGVDVNKFYPLENKSSLFKIGCVANFWELKDQITLIKALEVLIENNIIDWECEFIGTGPTKQKCLDYVKRNNMSNITFTNKISHSNLNQFYNNLDVFVLPSYYEALGCVYLESWATNTPFIAVKNQGIEELLDETVKQKYLIDKNDYKSLAKKIIFFKNNNESITFDTDYNIEKTISNFLLFLKNN